MRKLALVAAVALPLAVAGGLVYANSARQSDTPRQANAEGYTCPVTGEELPCPACCPYQQGQ